MTTKLRPHLSTLLLACIFVVLSASTIAWALRDRTPPPWDPSDHLRYAYDYYRLLAHADFAGFAREFFQAKHYYAPFVHLITAMVFVVFGVSKATGIIVNLLSLAAMLWAAASISRKLYSTVAKDGGITPAPSVSLCVLPGLIAACYHFSAWLFHDAFVDYPLTAAVTVVFALLIRADDFRVRRDALAFGVTAGIGMLVKQTFMFFFILPALYVVIRVLWTRDRRAILNLGLAVVVLILIAAIWYGPHLDDVIAIYRENQRAAINENEEPLYSFHSNFYYVHALISMQMQLPLAAVFVAGLIFSLARRFKQSVILYLWLASGIASFALVANKDVRYTVPVLPAAAILSVCWLGAETSRIKYVRAARLILIAAIAAWSFVSFFNAQWPTTKPGWGTAIDTPYYRWMVLARNYYGFDHRPLDDDWSVPEIVRTVTDFGRDPRAPAKPPVQPDVIKTTSDHSAPVLGVVVNLPYLNPSSIAFYARLLAEQRAIPPPADVCWIVEPSMIGRIPQCDYILVRTGLDKGDWVTTIERDVERLIRENPARFVRVGSIPVTALGAETVIYRHDRE